MKQKKYYNHNFDVGLISDMAQKLNLHEKIVELLFSRGFTTEEQIKSFLLPSQSDFMSPFGLLGMQQACEQIKNAISNNKRILVFGDYDVDGLSATAIMIKTFEKLNKKVDYYLPNRFIDGYGLTNAVIDKIKNKYNPDLIITVDCGISCKNEVEYAKSLGIEMIVTDHHELPNEIPNCVVINPKILNQQYDFHDLCGTGVAFKISEALLGHDTASEFLPIAAIATIADIVSLTRENRAIVYFGLKLFEKYLPAGLKALLSDNKLSVKNICSTDIAFKIAPKLNAAGRMGEASESLKLILAKTPAEIKTQISKIAEYNSKRQIVCNECYADCVEMLKSTNLSNERAIILYNRKWDHGILGIVAARLVDAYNRPAFLFSEEDGVLKGSARSLLDINVHELLSSCSDILVTYGGHKMAAGLTLKKENFDEFSKRVNSFIFANVSPKAFEPISYYDLDISLNDLSDKFFDDLQLLEPFGLDNSNPLFRICADDAMISPLKNFNQHFNITFSNKLGLIYFNCSDKYFDLKFAKNKYFVFELQKERYKGSFKGIVKYFEGDFSFDKSFKNDLDAIELEQLRFLKFGREIDLSEYEESEIINLVSSGQNPFGTIFVSNKLANYNEFISKYCLDNIYEKFVFNNFSSGGFNAVCLYPTDVEIFKDYLKIVFLEPVLDKSYLAKISQISNAKIYIPKNGTFDKKLLCGIDTRREKIGDFYNALKSVNWKNFVNELHAYNRMLKLKRTAYKNFHAYLMIFEELNLITIDNSNGFTIIVNNDCKTDLKNSKIYNYLNFYANLFKNNDKKIKKREKNENSN